MITLDWLSVVVGSDRREIIDYLVVRLGEVLATEFQSCGGLHGYEHSQRCDGVVIAYGGATQHNTLLLSLSGSVTSVLGWYGSAALVRAIIKRFGVSVKFSRIDLALDVAGEWWQYFDHPDRVYERLQDGRISKVVIVNDYDYQEDWTGYSDEEKKRLLKLVSGKDGEKVKWKLKREGKYPSMHTSNWIVTGHTTYIGSRTSERFMRIYKKQKDDGQKVTRFEYELKERYAAVVGSMMLDGGTIGAAYIFANAKHIDISDIYDLSQVCEEPCVSLPRKKTNRRFRWLMAISAALVEFIESHPDMWETVLQEGERRLTPVGNTGVHFSVPEWLNDIDQQALNLDTFGSVYHPIPYYRMNY